MKIDQFDEDSFCFENSYILCKFVEKRKIDESYDMKFNQCNENLLKFWIRHPFNAHLSL